MDQARGFRVTYVGVAFPRVATRPNSAHEPWSQQDLICDSNGAPCVHVIVRCPTVHPVRGLNQLAPYFARFASRLCRELIRFTRVHRFNQPVIRFGVSVAHMFAVPKEGWFVVPGTLRVDELPAQL